MTPDEQAALDFMRDMQRAFGELEFRVTTARFTAVSPGVNPLEPLGESPRSGAARQPFPAVNSTHKSAADALRRVKG
ncbi:hypothetical protein ACW4YW_15145 [Methylobacillus pratensis]